MGVTAYRIYNSVHIVKLKRWDQMLRNSWNRQPELLILTMSMSYTSGKKFSEKNKKGFSDGLSHSELFHPSKKLSNKEKCL